MPKIKNPHPIKEIKIALDWYSKYNDYRITIVKNGYKEDILSFDEWLTMLLK
jgi:hypothetical protein